jgi:hypothetical protein
VTRLRLQILAPDDRLKRRVGEVTRKLRSHETGAAVGDAARELDQVARADIEGRLRSMETLARERSGPLAIPVYEAAHCIRSIAGTFRMDRLGRIADCICRYVKACGETRIDANKLTLLVIAARHTNSGARDEDMLADELVEECEALVANQVEADEGSQFVAPIPSPDD